MNKPRYSRAMYTEIKQCAETLNRIEGSTYGTPKWVQDDPIRSALSMALYHLSEALADLAQQIIDAEDRKP